MKFGSECMLTTDRLVNTLNLELLTGEEGLDRPIKTQIFHVQV